MVQSLQFRGGLADPTRHTPQIERACLEKEMAFKPLCSLCMSRDKRWSLDSHMLRSEVFGGPSVDTAHKGFSCCEHESFGKLLTPDLPRSGSAPLQTLRVIIAQSLAAPFPRRPAPCARTSGADGLGGYRGRICFGLALRKAIDTASFALSCRCHRFSPTWHLFWYLSAGAFVCATQK